MHVYREGIKQGVRYIQPHMVCDICHVLVMGHEALHSVNKQPPHTHTHTNSLQTFNIEPLTPPPIHTPTPTWYVTARSRLLSSTKPAAMKLRVGRLAGLTNLALDTYDLYAPRSTD